MANKAIALVAQTTRFERVRQEAATRATLQVAANLLEQTEKRIGRAHTLVEPAIGFDPPQRRNALREAVASIEEAIADLQEILQEIRL